MPDIGGLVTACKLGMGTVEVDNPFFIRFCTINILTSKFIISNRYDTIDCCLQRLSTCYHTVNWGKPLRHLPCGPIMTQKGWSEGPTTTVIIPLWLHEPYRISRTEPSRTHVCAKPGDESCAWSFSSFCWSVCHWLDESSWRYIGLGFISGLGDRSASMMVGPR